MTMEIPNDRYSPNWEHTRYDNPLQVDVDLDGVDQEIVRRQGHHLDTEDQVWRYRNLREARGSFN
jgi:hypothetical protein